MFRRRFAIKTILVTGVLAAVGLGGIAAQSSLQQKVDVEFPFIAAGQELPAGSYRLTTAKNKAGELEVLLHGKSTETHVPVITRLAPIHRSIGSVELVFDTTDGKRILSEVWLPTFDGFLVNASKGDHKHEVVSETSAN